MNKILFTVLVIILIAMGVYVFAIKNQNGDQNNNDKQTNMSNQQSDNSNQTNDQNAGVDIDPISHATAILTWNGKVLYTDPVGGASAFTGKAEPDVILLTDIHSDHFDLATLKAVTKAKTALVLPQAVADLIKEDLPGNMKIMKNGEKIAEQGFGIEAIPMYNLPESATAFHTKGRGNGYVVEANGKRVYVSGDTADIPEMRALKNIDIAFLCMNLPYTMSVESAADAVLAFKPKQVIPYHYRGQDGLSDVNKFKQLVNAGDPSIEVSLLNWYPQ